MGEAEIAAVLPDHDSVALVFHFYEDDLCILPMRRRDDGKPTVIHKGAGTLKLKDARPAFDELLNLQDDTLRLINELEWYAEGDELLNEQLEALEKDGGLDLERLPGILNRMLRIDDLLPLIEPDPEKWPGLHLVLLPDGPLFRLPLHAAAVTFRGKHPHLIDVVGSVRYALSLRTLHTLGKVEAEQAAASPNGVPLRGTAFVNPAGHVGDVVYGRRLDLAPLEFEYLVGNSPPKSWQIFGERQESPDWLANRANMKVYHSTPTLLWTVCHAGMMSDMFKPLGFDTEQTVVNPSLLLADGPLSTARMVSDGYDFRRSPPVAQFVLPARAARNRRGAPAGRGVHRRPDPARVSAGDECHVGTRRPRGRGIRQALSAAAPGERL